MGKIRVKSGDVAAGIYEAGELALGIERVEEQESAKSESVAVLGVTALGERPVTFTAHLLAGGTFQAVTDRQTFEMLQRFLQPLSRPADQTAQGPTTPASDGARTQSRAKPKCKER